jgi:hypothetical protein
MRVEGIKRNSPKEIAPSFCVVAGELSAGFISLSMSAYPRHRREISAIEVDRSMTLGVVSVVHEGDHNIISGREHILWYYEIWLRPPRLDRGRLRRFLSGPSVKHAARGAEFLILPIQNASGGWLKVMQQCNMFRFRIRLTAHLKYRRVLPRPD